MSVQTGAVRVYRAGVIDMQKATAMTSAVTEQDLEYLRQAIALSHKAVENGERPFGAIVVGPDGKVLSATTGKSFENSDMTAHAEMTAIRLLNNDYSADYLMGATLYSSTEPCAMCAGAIYWANIGRLVFGVGEERLRGTRNTGSPTALTMGCRAVLATGQAHPTIIEGPLLEEEAMKPHAVFWKSS